MASSDRLRRLGLERLEGATPKQRRQALAEAHKATAEANARASAAHVAAKAVQKAKPPR